MDWNKIVMVTVLAVLGLGLWGGCGETGGETNQNQQQNSDQQNDGSNTGNDGSNTGNDGSNTGNDGSNTGNDGSNTGNDTTNTGNDGSNTGNGGELQYSSIWSSMTEEYGCANSSCHGSIETELDDREDVVDVASDCDSDILLVDPGNSEESLLWRIVSPDIDASDVCGTKMPPNLGGEEFDAEIAQNLADWIDEGAP